MTKPEPFDRRRVPDHPARAAKREPRDPGGPEEEILEREIKRLQRESEEALAAYRHAFEEPVQNGRTTVPRRFP